MIGKRKSWEENLRPSYGYKGAATNGQGPTGTFPMAESRFATEYGLLKE